MSIRPRIGLLSLSAIPDDPRVRRQGDLFYRNGFDVIAWGLPNWRSDPPAWPCRVAEKIAPSNLSDAPHDTVLGIKPQIAAVPGSSASVQQPGITIVGQSAIRHSRALAGRVLPGTVKRTLGQALSLTVSGASRARSLATKIRLRSAKLSDQAAIHFSQEAAFRTYWKLNGVFSDLYESAVRERVDVWLANDWSSLPIVQRLAREQNVPYMYDTHELAVFEYTQNLSWRLGMRPVIAAIERAGIHEAVAVSCVSDGIAERLHSFHKLDKRPIVIRNMPNYAESTFRPVSEKIRVLYHGMIFPGRGLEEAIESLPKWRDEFHFTIRGPGPDDYISSLKALADRHGVSERVTFAPPVPMIALVREAQTFDVGFFAIRGHSLQNTYVLPNKFFEYAMAGLALCVSDLPEMRKLLDRYRMGILMRQCEPAAIAQAVNSLTRPNIDDFKRKSLEAAKELCWENEGKVFLDMAEHALRQRARQIQDTNLA